MEIGPLSEWVTAVAEIIVVCTALFLPYLNQVRDVNRRAKKFSRTIEHLTDDVLAGKEKTLKQFSLFLGRL